MKPRYLFAGLIILIIVVNALGGYSSSVDKPEFYAVGAWLLTIGLLVWCFAVIGRIPSGNPPVSDWRGVLIDQRNRISLSRLQLVLWSLMVISAVVSEGILNAMWGVPGALSLGIPKELWILLGLSSGTAVAAPLVLSTKTNNGNTTLSTKAPNQHRWSDVFYGDETGNDDQVDFSKVQQFFFTVVLVVVYAVEIGALMLQPVAPPGSAAGAKAMLFFPALDAGFLGIMAVSQVAYISYKALPQNKTDDTKH